MSAQTVDLLINHCYLLTLDPQRRIFEDGSVAIKDGKIAAVGRAQELSGSVFAKKVLDAKGALVHPGLIDAHEHLCWHLTRGWVPDYFSIEQTFAEFENRLIHAISEEDEYYGTVLACLEMALNGTTAFGDTGSASSIDRIVEAACAVGIRGRVGYIIADQMAPELSKLDSTTEECLRKLEYQISKYPASSDTLIGCWVGLVGMGECSDTLLVEAKRLADSYDIIFNIHQSYSQAEVTGYMDKIGGIRPIEHLQNLGVLGPALTLVHMIALTPPEVEILADTKTNVVHCPGASMRFGLGSSNKGSFPEMLEKGIPVALGTDAGNWSDSLDICRMAYLAATMHKEARGKTPVISAEAALEMATIHGARCMGMEDDIGSIEIGKRADIVIHNLKHPESHPPFDPLNNFIFSSQSKSVDTVLVDGQIIVENGKPVQVDAIEIYEKVERIAFDLSKRMGYSVKRTWPIIRSLGSG